LVQAEGTLSIQGSGSVAAVLANLVDSMRAATGAGTGGDVSDKRALPDFLTVARAAAQVTGMTPVENKSPLAGGDLARVGLFTNQALDLGLDSDTVEDVVRHTRHSPDGTLPTDTRRHLTEVLVTQGYGERSASEQIDRLEHLAQRLPETLTVYGQRMVEVALESSEPNAKDEEQT